MATDIKTLITNLLSFHDFENQTIISIGAGEGQFVEYARTASKVYAIDSDIEALNNLNVSLEKANLSDKFILIHADFEQTNLKGDIVFFEFSLHEMKDAESAIKRAQTMAPVVLISDHLPNSEWTFIVGEDLKVADSWNAIESFNLRKCKMYDTTQYFTDYEELYQKVKVQGDEVVKRISKFADQTCIEIPMSYGFVLI